ncbi:hypothetical protein [Massilia sp. IC2-476]|uniref:hypothetical protein n=1 Tax=Massilia sp. IC2-476 TaxID=2887199 RepID=UPI001D118106|nr:hypothetical protein [Massilia sp. IC2-476]MCC2974236.1 hypothetical protein [Massilia sp. IC2-476]
MKRCFAALAAWLLCAPASACPELDALAKRYGITFGGFLAPISAVKLPAFSKTGDLLHLRLPSPEFVSDGFRHKVVYDTSTAKAWILRTGGFLGVRQWYGPVDAGDAKLENCRAEAEKVVPPIHKS